MTHPALNLDDEPGWDLGQDIIQTDANPKWSTLREEIERRAKEPGWWRGIWDDTATPYGMTEAILLRLSDQLHHDYMHGGKLRNLAVEIVHAHVDEEVRDAH